MTEDKHCQDLISYLSDYVDGALNEDLCAELEEHLAHCPNCQIVVNTLKRTIELYQKCNEDECLSDPARKELYAKLNLENYIHVK
jgi:anti-sigma factor RsiW